MTDGYFFDTDCLSAFLWVRGENILSKLYAGRIVLPAQVYGEIQRVPHLLARVDELKDSGALVLGSMETGSTEYQDYLQMTSAPEEGMKLIGKGEAACIAMAKERGGILASNNMKDIMPYINKYGIPYITTGDIFVEALNAGLITEEEGNELWSNMLQKRRRLPTESFSEYLCSKG